MPVSITDDDVFIVLQDFILAVIPDLTGPASDPLRNVRQGQQNDTPLPPGPDFVVMVPTDRAVLATTVREYFPPLDPAPAEGRRDTTRATQVGCMVNFYGPNSTDYAQIFNTLFRDLYGCDFMREAGVQPLWCDDGRQMPLVDSEKQYTARWMIRALMQINPTVSTPQQFADTVDLTLVEAD